MSEELYEMLEARNRAISNWKRLKIVIAILRLANGKMVPVTDKKQQDEEKETISFDDKIVKYIFLPTGRVFLVWSTVANFIYLIQIFLDTAIIGYGFQPLKTPLITTTQSIMSGIMIVDVLRTFFTAIPKSDSGTREQEEEAKIEKQLKEQEDALLAKQLKQDEERKLEEMDVI